MADSIGAEAYARAIERLLEGADDRALIVSRRDFEKIENWRRNGIPPAFVEEQWHELRRSARERLGSAPRLSKLMRVVDEAWAVVLDGRRGSAPRSQFDPGPERPDQLVRWGPGADEPTTPELDRFLSELRSAHEKGADAHEIDRRIDSQIAQLAPRELLEEVRAEVERELDAYRDRIAREKLQSSAERAIRGRLRRRLRLPRVAEQEFD